LKKARRGHAKARGHELHVRQSRWRRPANDAIVQAIADDLDALLVKRADELANCAEGSSAVGEFEAIRDAFEAYEAVVKRADPGGNGSSMTPAWGRTDDRSAGKQPTKPACALVMVEDDRAGPTTPKKGKGASGVGCGGAFP
jgi:hypothetical protein